MTLRPHSALIAAIAIALGSAGCDRAPPPQSAAPAADVLPDTAPPAPVSDLPPEPARIDLAAPVASIADRAERRDNPPRADVEPPISYAQVISVTPVRDKTAGSHQECRDVEVTRRAPVKDENRVAGTAIGAVVGGLVGNQVGGGRGRDLATVAGAVGGGFAGRKIQENQQNQRVVTSVEQRCRTVKDEARGNDIVAYDIVYAYAGESHKARIDHDPGDRIALPVRSID